MLTEYPLLRQFFETVMYDYIRGDVDAQNDNYVKNKLKKNPTNEYYRDNAYGYAMDIWI